MPTTECGFAGQPDLLARARPNSDPVLIGLDHDLMMAAATRTDAVHGALPALVDTGSDTTCIDSDLAYALNLPVADQMIVSGVHSDGAWSIFTLPSIYMPGSGRRIFWRCLLARAWKPADNHTFCHLGSRLSAPLPLDLRRAHRRGHAQQRLTPFINVRLRFGLSD